MQVNEIFLNDALERASIQDDFELDEGGGNDRDSIADDFLHDWSIITQQNSIKPIGNEFNFHNYPLQSCLQNSAKT